MSTTERTATVMLTDLVGSTGHLFRLGQEAAEAQRLEHFGLLRDAIERYGGEELRSTGDGLLVVFGHPSNAYATAIEIQRALRERNARPDTDAFDVRVGLHMGTLVRDEDEWLGTAVRVADTLCNSADGSGIRVSELVSQICPPPVDSVDAGQLAVDGVADVVAARDLDWAAVESAPAPAVAPWLFFVVALARGDQATPELESRVRTELTRTVSRHGGDSVLAAKAINEAGVQVTLSSAVAAVGVAAMLQRSVERLNRDLAPELRFGLSVGVDAGEPTEREGEYFGEPLVLATRLSQSAAPGAIHASEPVGHLIAGEGHLDAIGIGQRPLGGLALKGVPEPLEAVEVTWPSGAEHRAPLPQALGTSAGGRFLGRVDELQKLEGAWERSVQGARSLLLVGGQPGVGKTSLAREFAHRRHERGATVLFGRSFREALVPYEPFAGALREYVGICPLDELYAQTEDVRPELVRLVPELADRIPDVPEAVRGDPDGERARIFDAVDSLLTRASQLAPVVLLLDDLHWADRDTLALAKHLMRSDRPARILIVATYRHAEVESSDPVREMITELSRERILSRLALAGFDAAGTAVLLQSIAGQSVSATVAERVHSVTEGNPFFVEEVWQNLIESNVLVQDAGGGWDIDRAAPEIVIPASVKDVIDQRVERLAETARRSLGRASVIGREFDFKVLERIAGIEEDELLDAIDDGLAAQLLVEAPPVEDRYSFAHALIRETLYEQQSSARRRRLHRRIGEAIEGLHAGDLDGQLPALARHFAKAGGDQVSKAVDYGMQAGQQAMEQAAYEQAEEHLVRSLDLLGAMPDTPELIGMEIGLQVMRGPGLMALKGCGCGEMEEAYARAWDLGQKLGDHPDMAPVLWGMWIYNYTHARLDKALDLAQRLDAMAQSAGGSDGLLHSSHSLWATLFFRGDLAAAESYLQRGRELYDPDRGVVDVLRYGGHDAGMCSRIFGSLSAWMHGDVERSRQLEAEGLELAGEMSPINAAFALDWAAVRHQMDGDHEAAGTLSARAIDLATRHQLAQWLAMARMLRGWAQAADGDPEGGIALLKTGLEPWDGMCEWGRPYFLGLLADAQERDGRRDAALATLGEAIALVDSGGERWWEAELHRMQGELLAKSASGESTAAERALRRAVEVAGEQGARALEERAEASLSRYASAVA